MTRKFWITVALAAAAAVGALYLWKPPLPREPAKQAAQPAAKDEYYCPMHPQQRSDKPGNCPICSMKMVKLEQPGEGPKAPAKAGPAAAPAVFIAPERQQLIGVRTVAVERRPLVREIRTVGRVAFDETRIAHVHAKVPGFIEEVFVNFVGQPVRQGQPLFTIYSPDLVATQEEYLLALRSSRALKDSSFDWISGGSRNLLEAARRRLQLWDIAEEEIQELEKTGKAKRALTIHSQVSGIVTQRAAYHHGKYVTPEMELYTIVDLSTVWILGDVFESDLPYAREGQAAVVEFPFPAGRRERAGRVVFLSPTVDPKTRAVQVRVEFPNPNQTLRPEMFVHFKLRASLGSPLAVPSDAVLDTGTEQYVFVDKGQGYFEPRPVRLGAEAGGYYGIESGLRAGERVVTSANFILDSESRLKGLLAPPRAEGSGHDRRHH